MRYTTTSLLAFVVLVMCAFSSISFAADPSEDDVTVIGLGGPPACWFEESQILMSNTSSEYDYKVQVSATAKNDDNGPSGCSGSCQYVSCEYSLSGNYTADANDSRNVKISCNFPSIACAGCDTNCDNEDCEDITHCSCVVGSYLVTHYAATGTEIWYPMLSTSWTDITQEQKQESGISLSRVS